VPDFSFAARCGIGGFWCVRLSGRVSVTDLAEGLGVRRPGPFADLEALRAAAELPVARFAALAGIPERTYHRRLATLRSGDAPVKGPWPTPAVDAAEALAAKYAADWPAWGHRKIAAMMRADGHQASTSTVERALRRRGLLLPRGFRPPGSYEELAAAR